MNYQNSFSISIALMSLAAASSLTSIAHAGGRDGGGGVGVECRRADGTTSFVTLDYYEAVNRGLTFPVNPNDKNAVAAFAVSRFLGNDNEDSDPEYVRKVTQWTSSFLDGNSSAWQEAQGWSHLALYTNTVFSANLLPLTNDYGQYSISENCRLKQIAVYSDGNIQKRKDATGVDVGLSILAIDSNAFSRLDYLNRAILLVHEQTYVSERLRPDETGFNSSESITIYMDPSYDRTSMLSRKFVGELLSSNGLPRKHLSGYPYRTDPKDSHWCSEDLSLSEYIAGDFDTEENNFTVYLSESGSGTLMEFAQIAEAHAENSVFDVLAYFSGIPRSSFENSQITFKSRAEIFLNGFSSTGLFLSVERTVPGQRMEYRVTDKAGRLYHYVPHPNWDSTIKGYFSCGNRREDLTARREKEDADAPRYIFENGRPGQ